MRYFILQECWGGHRSYLAPMAYTERGFDSRHKARRHLDKYGRRFSPRVVREDRIGSVSARFAAQHN